MTKNPIFKGACTALVTPMIGNEIDYESFGKIIDWQIEEGIDALLIAGTSGEGSTLSDEEHRDVLDFAIKRIAGRVPAIAATGSNDTAYAIDLNKHACEAGYDGMLLVTPYYNKATQNGLVKMYTAIADSSTKPVILYNVPSRTGINIEPSTYLALADHPMISGIKEANGNISKIVETVSLVGEKLDIYSGNDDQIVPILALGGTGVISVLSNVMPKVASRMCHAYFEGSYQESLDLQLKLLPLINALFSEVNPIPVKAAMKMMGWCRGDIRLPLTEMEPQHEEILRGLMKEQGLVR